MEVSSASGGGFGAPTIDLVGGGDDGGDGGDKRPWREKTLEKVDLPPEFEDSEEEEEYDENGKPLNHPQWKDTRFLLA